MSVTTEAETTTEIRAKPPAFKFKTIAMFTVRMWRKKIHGYKKFRFYFKIPDNLKDFFISYYRNEIPLHFELYDYDDRLVFTFVRKISYTASQKTSDDRMFVHIPHEYNYLLEKIYRPDDDLRTVFTVVVKELDEDGSTSRT